MSLSANNHRNSRTVRILGLNTGGEETLTTVTLREPTIEDYYDLMEINDDSDSDINDNDNDDDDDGDGEVSKARPASQSSIEKLERIKIERSVVCSICLEEITIGSEAIRMPNPCSHVHHQHCIIKWFQKGNTCPLCRYEMPH